jgi:hypothetical protein
MIISPRMGRKEDGRMRFKVKEGEERERKERRKGSWREMTRKEKKARNWNREC